MRTLLNKAQQEEFLNKNWELAHISHKWSSRGDGNSKILNSNGDVIGSAGGCGYDRFGSALGAAVLNLFPNEVHKLAVKTRKIRGYRKTYQPSGVFYGLIYNQESGKARLEGACGSHCIEEVLAAIGFELEQCGERIASNSGEVFYTLRPLYSQWAKERIKEKKFLR